MKKPCLFIVGLVMMVTQFGVSKALAQGNIGKPIQPVFYQLTEQDKHNYILTAGRPLKIKQDTFIYKLTPGNFQPVQEKCDAVVIPVTFINNSNDTLQYIGMSCSWWDIYKTDSPQIYISEGDNGCYKNGPVVIKVAPKTSSVVNLDIVVKKKQGQTANFRIGMVLEKAVDGKSSLGFTLPQMSNNVIWTNEIQLY